MENGFAFGGKTWMVSGMGKSAPMSAASPGFKLGRNDEADRSISPYVRALDNFAVAVVGEPMHH